MAYLNFYIEVQHFRLKYKVEDYVWDRVQSDYILNNHGSFLFKVFSYDELILKIEEKIMKGL